MSFFSLLTGGAKQAEKLRLRKEEQRLTSAEQRLEKFEAVLATIEDQLSLHKVLTVTMLQRQIRSHRAHAGLSRADFRKKGRFGLFSASGAKRQFKSAQRKIGRAVSELDRVSIGLFTAGASLNALVALDHYGILDIPDWHRPLADILADANFPASDLLLEVAAEVGADTILDIIGDVTIVIGLAKGLLNMVKTAEFSSRADALACTATDLEKKIADHEASLNHVREHGQAYDHAVYELFKTLATLRSIKGKVFGVPRAFRKRIREALPLQLAELKRLQLADPFPVSV